VTNLFKHVEKLARSPHTLAISKDWNGRLLNGAVFSQPRSCVLLTLLRVIVPRIIGRRHGKHGLWITGPMAWTDAISVALRRSSETAWDGHICSARDVATFGQICDKAKSYCAATGSDRIFPRDWLASNYPKKHNAIIGSMLEHYSRLQPLIVMDDETHRGNYAGELGRNRHYWSLWERRVVYCDEDFTYDQELAKGEGIGLIPASNPCLEDIELRKELRKAVPQGEQKAPN